MSKFHKSVPVMALLVSFVSLWLCMTTACYSPTLPLPPPARDGITLSPPDDEGFVIVVGEPGVMEAGEQAVITNLDTLYGWIVPVTDEGFEAAVIAESGHILSVQRQAGGELGQSLYFTVSEE